jgi:hypothetical protein
MHGAEDKPIESEPRPILSEEAKDVLHDLALGM